MFRDDPSNSCLSVNIFKENIVKKAASMLVQHVSSQKKFTYEYLNSNTNAFDEDQHIRREKIQCKRMNKCNSWLTNYPNERSLVFDQ